MQVPAALTPSSAPHIASAIIGAYQDLRGYGPPTKSSWLWPLALSANETRSWAALWNWNVGNVTTSGSGDVSWFLNPHVTDPLKFLAFSDARSGARSMLKILDKYGGLAAADTGDSKAWQHALDKYLGSGSYPPLSSLITKLQDTQPEDGYEIVTPPSAHRNTSLILVTAAALGMAAVAGYAAYQRREVFS